LASSSKNVAEILARDLTNIDQGTAHDELTWIDIQEHSVKILNQQGKHLFVTAYEAMEHPDMIDQAKKSDHEVIIIPVNLKDKIKDSTDLTGEPIIDIGQFVSNYNDSFEFNFVTPNQLTFIERQIYNHTSNIVNLLDNNSLRINDIKISNTMRRDFFSDVETLGCCDHKTKSIVISRKTLKTLEDYSGTLIHELVHATTGYVDVSRDFETSLTEVIGSLCEKILKNNYQKS